MTYEEMRRLAMFLLTKLGGEVTITEDEKVDFDYNGLAIEFSDDPATFSTLVRLIEDRTRHAASDLVGQPTLG